MDTAKLRSGGLCTLRRSGTCEATQDLSMFPGNHTEHLVSYSRREVPVGSSLRLTIGEEEAAVVVSAQPGQSFINIRS